MHLFSLCPRGEPGHLLSESLHPLYRPFADGTRLRYERHAIDYSQEAYQRAYKDQLKSLGETAARYVYK